MRASKVAAHVGLTDTHDSTGAGRQVHLWAHDSKAAVLKVADTPVAPKVVATSAAASTAHPRDAVTIENVSPARRKVVGLNANALSVDPKADDSNVNDSLARAAANSNASDLQVRHVDEVLNANASQARPNTTFQK